MTNNDLGELFLKVVGAIAAVVTFRWVYKIFAGPDKVIDAEDLRKLTAYFLFVGSFIYMLISEGQRTDCVNHKFSELWVLIVTIALLYVLSMEKVIDLIMTLKKRGPEEKPKEETQGEQTN